MQKLTKELGLEEERLRGGKEEVEAEKREEAKRKERDLQWT